MFPCSADHVNRIGNLLVDLYPAICDDNTYIDIYCCSVYPQLPPVFRAPWGYCGRGFLFPVGYGSVGVQLTRLRRLNQGTLTSEYVRKNLNATVLQVTCTMQQSSRVFYLNTTYDIVPCTVHSLHIDRHKSGG